MDLSTFLKDPGVKLLDGAVGTELAKLGLGEGGQNCISNPDEVTAIHNQYIAAGAQMIMTNTLTMNRIFIETHKVGVDVRAVNLAGAKIARSCAVDGQFVLGNISSTGKMLEPYGEYSESEFVDVFMEQAASLAEGGVDGFIIETIFDLREALCAVRACRQVSSLPIIAGMAFNVIGGGGMTTGGGVTIMGNPAGDCAERLAEAGVASLGANCGDLDPEEMADIVSVMHSVTDLPILAEPNAGKPRFEKGRTFFDLEPGAFARGVKRCIESGAVVVGGCCGTSPEHIRALAEVLREMEVNTPGGNSR